MIECLLKLVLRAHHERTIVVNWSVIRLAYQNNDSRIVFYYLKSDGFVKPTFHKVGYFCCSCVDHSFTLDADWPCVTHDQQISSSWDHMIVNVTTFVKNEVNKVRRCSRNDGNLKTENFAWDDFKAHTGIALERRSYSVEVLLLPRLKEFILCGQVDPKLDASTSNIKDSGHFCMYNAFSNSYPLDITRDFHTTVAFECFVIDFSSYI